MKRNQKNKDYRPLKVVSFFAALFIISIIAFIIPLRPTHSASEKRDLAKFPEFSIAALTSGSYFDDISTWFSDTFPFREGIVEVKGFLEGWQGIRTVQVHGDINNADAIPDAPMSTPSSEPVSEPLSEPSSEPESEPAFAPTDDPVSSEESSEPTSEDAVSSEESLPPEEEEEIGIVQNFNGILQVGDSAYEYFTFNLDVANRYITAINNTAADLKGVANVYDIIVPTSMSIVLPNNLLKQLGVSDQKEAIDYMYGSMSEDVHTVEIFDLLRSDRKEYLYFRTDHHWTARGAYYAYAGLMDAMDLEPRALEDYNEGQIDDFLGSFYAATGMVAALAENPDTVYTYTTDDDISMAITGKDGKAFAWPLVNDTTSYPRDLKYCCFIGGDYPYTIVENNSLTNGKSCVVVKESFGNAFVPYLVDNYQTIHVIDYRYWNGSLASFVKEVGAEDVIYINNISVTRADMLVSHIERIR